jgi:hypothetical protein
MDADEHGFMAAKERKERKTKNFDTNFTNFTNSSPSPRSSDKWGETDATLAHRMGEGLGVRVSGEVSNSNLSTFNSQLFLASAKFPAQTRRVTKPK